LKKKLIAVGVAAMRAEPSGKSELVSQAILNTSVVILDHSTSGWCMVQTPDQYQGWIEDRDMTDWDESSDPQKRMEESQIVQALWTFVRSAPNLSSPARVEVVRGSRLIVNEQIKDWVSVSLPSRPLDKIGGYIPKKAFRDMIRPSLADKIVADARDCLGISYLWGGSTPKGFDCSGLTQAVFLWNRIPLPRDASQQAKIGKFVRPDPDYGNLLPGDLIFFGPTDEKINHVALSIGSRDYIHAGACVEFGRLSSDKQPRLIKRIVPDFI